MKFKLFIFPLFLVLCSCSSIQSIEVESQGVSGTVIEYGIFARSREDAIMWSNELSTNNVIWEGGEATLIEQTDLIPIIRGIYFAFKYEIKNLPEGDVALDWKVIHPPIKKTDGTVSTGYSYKRTVVSTGGYTDGISGYSLDEDYEMVPGIWVFSYSYNGKLLAEQKFELIANE